MPSYRYVAYNEDGRKKRGTMNAFSDRDLEGKLQNLKMDVISYKEAKPLLGGIGSGKVNIKELIALFIHFEQLDKAGVPLLDSIEDIKDSVDSATLRNVMNSIYDSIKGGKMLSEAMREFPKSFDEIIVSLVAAGERTGNLSESFQYIVNHLKWTSDIKRKVKKATMYPLFMIFVLIVMMCVMMIIVVPKVSEFLLQQNIELPITTTSLIAFSKFIQKYILLLIAFPTGIFIGIKVMTKTSKKFAYNADKIKLKIPIVGPTLKKIDLAKFCQFFSITYKSGIDILECIESTKFIVSNRFMRKNIDDIKKSISEGSSITQSIQMCGQFPSLVIRMFKVGEDSGNMGSSLDNVKFFYDREINDSIDKMVGVIQPSLTIIMAGMMLWVAAGVFGPIYGSFGEMMG